MEEIMKQSTLFLERFSTAESTSSSGAPVTMKPSIEAAPTLGTLALPTLMDNQLNKRQTLTAPKASLLPSPPVASRPGTSLVPKPMLPLLSTPPMAPLVKFSQPLLATLPPSTIGINGPIPLLPTPSTEAAPYYFGARPLLAIPPVSRAQSFLGPTPAPLIGNNAVPGISYQCAPNMPLTNSVPVPHMINLWQTLTAAQVFINGNSSVISRPAQIYLNRQNLSTCNQQSNQGKLVSGNPTRKSDLNPASNLEPTTVLQKVSQLVEKKPPKQFTSTQTVVKEKLSLPAITQKTPCQPQNFEEESAKIGLNSLQKVTQTKVGEDNKIPQILTRAEILNLREAIQRKKEVLQKTLKRLQEKRRAAEKNSSLLSPEKDEKHTFKSKTRQVDLRKMLLKKQSSMNTQSPLHEKSKDTIANDRFVHYMSLLEREGNFKIPEPRKAGRAFEDEKRLRSLDDRIKQILGTWCPRCLQAGGNCNKPVRKLELE